MYLFYVRTSLKCKVHVTNLQLIGLDGNRSFQKHSSPDRVGKTLKGGVAEDMRSPGPPSGAEVSQKVCLLQLTVSVLWKIRW